MALTPFGSFGLPTQNTNFFPSQSLGFVAGTGFGQQVANPQASLMGMVQMLQQLLGSLTQLSQGWNGFLGQPPVNNGFPQNQGQFPNFGTNSGPPAGFSAAPYSQFLSNSSFIPTGGYIPPAATTGFGGLYGGSDSTGQVAVPTLPRPVDSNDAASYLKAQVAGGALQGNTAVRQADGIPGTRFAQVQPANLWHANVGRLYSYQFAAYATGANALTPEGVQAGAQALDKMSPEAQLFMQVAAVFKGNMLNGPGFYDNPGLKNLLIQHGRADLAAGDGVGQTDVQSIGSVARAINEGSLTLEQVIQSGTIDNLNRYHQVIQYVQGGQFATDNAMYDRYAL